MMKCLFIIADANGKDFLLLPTYELENGIKLFSTDAVAKYLFPEEGLQRDEVCQIKSVYGWKIFHCYAY